MTDYLVNGSDLTSIANAIRTKGGTSASLEFPTEFVSAINAIPTGGGSSAISIVDTLDSGGGTIRTITAVNLDDISKDSSDLTASGATVTAPAGFYASDATKTVSSMTLPTSAAASATSGYSSKATISRSTSDQYINIPTGYNSAGAYYKVNAVANGTEGTPSATKGTVSNHSVTVTPSVTNSAGYISGGTKTGTAVTVSASELVSGSETKTANGTYNVTNLAELVVAVSGSGGLEYESGTYTPASNIAQPTISFANTHSTTPMIAIISDISAASSITSNSNLCVCYAETYKYTNTSFPSSTSAVRYGFVYYYYRSSSNSNYGNVTLSYNSNDTGNSSTSYARYWVTESSFKPSSNSTSRYFRSGRSYKWIAVWAPTT